MFGLPEMFHSDRGTVFENQITCQLQPTLGYLRARTTTYRSQGYSVSEPLDRRLLHTELPSPFKPNACRRIHQRLAVHSFLLQPPPCGRAGMIQATTGRRVNQIVIHRSKMIPPLIHWLHKIIRFELFLR